MMLSASQWNFVGTMLRTNALLIKGGSDTFSLRSKRLSKYFANMGDVMKDGRGIAETAGAYAQHLSSVGDLSYTIVSPAMKGIPMAPTIAVHLYEMTTTSLPFAFDYKKYEKGMNTEEVLRRERNISSFEEMDVSGAVDEFTGREMYGSVVDIVPDIDLDSIDAISATDTAGIAVAAAIAQRAWKIHNKNLRFGYTRPPKEHGDIKEKLIVGGIQEGDRVLAIGTGIKPVGEFYGDITENTIARIVDDVTTSGGAIQDTNVKLVGYIPQENVIGSTVAFYRAETKSEKDPRPVATVLEEAGLPLSYILTAPETFKALFLEGAAHGHEGVIGEVEYRSFLDSYRPYSTVDMVELEAALEEIGA